MSQRYFFLIVISCSTLAASGSVASEQCPCPIPASSPAIYQDINVREGVADIGPRVVPKSDEIKQLAVQYRQEYERMETEIGTVRTTYRGIKEGADIAGDLIGELPVVGNYIKRKTVEVAKE